MVQTHYSLLVSENCTNDWQRLLFWMIQFFLLVAKTGYSIHGWVVLVGLLEYLLIFEWLFNVQCSSVVHSFFLMNSSFFNSFKFREWYIRVGIWIRSWLGQLFVIESHFGHEIDRKSNGTFSQFPQLKFPFLEWLLIRNSIEATQLFTDDRIYFDRTCRDTIQNAVTWTSKAE